MNNETNMKQAQLNNASVEKIQNANKQIAFRIDFFT